MLDGLDPGDTGALQEYVAKPGPLVVVVDDIDELQDLPVEAVLTAMVRTPRDGHAIVAAGNAETMTSAYRGLAAELRRGRCGIHLLPAGVADDFFGVRAPRVDDPTPGRGVLVARGQWLPIQVAQP